MSIILAVTALRASPAPVTALAYSPDGSALVVGSQDGLEVRIVDHGRDLGRVELETKLDHIHDLAFSPDGRRLAAAGGKPAESGEIELWSWPERERVLSKRLHDDLIYAVAWSPDSNEFATASYDKRAGIWSAKDGARRLDIRGHSRAVLALAYTPDGRWLVTASVDRSLRVWNASTGERRRVLENHTDTVHDLAMRPTRDPDALPMLVSAGADRTVRLWQPTIGRLVRFVRLDAAPLAVAWSPSGDGIVAGCDDGSMRVIDPDTVEILKTEKTPLENAYAVAVSPKGKVALVAGKSKAGESRARAIEVSLERIKNKDRSEESCPD